MSHSQFTRRGWLALTGLGLAGGLWYARRRWWQRDPSPVFIAHNQRYDRDLTKAIRDGLIATGVDPKRYAGKRVLLKPNLVEPRRDRPQMTTHPSVVAAAIAVFRQAGAHVIVGEAPGHVRDTEMALIESGLHALLRDEGVPFADLNYECVRWFPNRTRCSRLRGLYLPRSIVEADLVVSMPKLKTHHWMGLTCAMKNLYGVLPGIKYGWPKNVLHHAGIPETVVDINAILPKTCAVVDGIECMEGDGPILGTSKWMGLLLVGSALPPLDATAARIMHLVPERIPYLALASKHLSSIRERDMLQRGENWRSVASRFALLDAPHLIALQN